MKLLTSFLLSITFIFLIAINDSIAQSVSKENFSLNKIEYSELNQNQYNPWTIHRKISAIGLGGSIAATFVGALSMNDQTFGTTVIPVVGPFITMTRIENDPALYYQPGGKQLLTAAGIVQSAFAAYFVASLIGESNYRGKHSSSNFSVAPTYTSKGLALSMNVKF